MSETTQDHTDTQPVLGAEVTAQLDHLVRMNPHDDFSTALRQHGFDIALAPNHDENVDVMVAIKGGSEGQAQQLLDQDMADWQHQMALAEARAAAAG